MTMPMFIIVHVEPLVPGRSPYETLIWIVSSVIIVLGVLFYLVLVRGESKEAARLEAHRAGLRKKRRGDKTISPPEDGGKPDEPLVS